MTGFFSSQFVLFVATGGIAALVNFFSRIAYSYWLGYSTAIVLAYLTGMVTAFCLAKAFVFRGSQQTLSRSATAFALVNLFAVAQVWVVSVSLAEYVLPAAGVEKNANEIAHAIGVAVPVFTSYLGHKHFSFR
jgi:putative flippase GtrA